MSYRLRPGDVVTVRRRVAAGTVVLEEGERVLLRYIDESSCVVMVAGVPVYVPIDVIVPGATGSVAAL